MHSMALWGYIYNIISGAQFCAEYLDSWSMRILLVPSSEVLLSQWQLSNYGCMTKHSLDCL